MALRDDIRDYVLLQGHSQRAAAKHFGVSRDTIARLLVEPAHAPARRYRRHKPHPAPVAAVVVPHIERWLAENEQLKRSAPKQRWTAHRMWVELGRLGISVAESSVRLYVRQRPGNMHRNGLPGVVASLNGLPGRRERCCRERMKMSMAAASVVIAASTYGGVPSMRGYVAHATPAPDRSSALSLADVPHAALSARHQRIVAGCAAREHGKADLMLWTVWGRAYP